jgi:D-serine deaminase-like pyridoxal phosphate-dependent protein
VALLDRARLSIIVDDLDVARGWSAAMSHAGRSLDVLVKIDVGFHRCGLDPDSPYTVQTIARIAELPGLRFRGLLSHAGHAYTASSADEIDELVGHETTWLNNIAGELRQAGTPVDEISVGSTPTARLIDRQPGVTEMRPGNYVFFDRTQAGLGAAPLDACALSVISTVVSRPAADRVILDAGSKTLTTDGVRGFGTPVGYGLVYPTTDAHEPDESIVLERLSEEHATARVPETCTLRCGDRVRILPNHACVVTNLADELLLVHGDAVVDRLAVAARGRNT